jgi:hypothetical protein
MMYDPLKSPPLEGDWSVTVPGTLELSLSMTFENEKPNVAPYAPAMGGKLEPVGSPLHADTNRARTRTRRMFLPPGMGRRS